MNQPWIYMYSLSRSPLPPPSAPHPSGSSHCTSPEHLSHASIISFKAFSNLFSFGTGNLFFFFLRNRKLSYSSPRHTYFYSVSQKCLFATPWTVICQASLPMGFPRQEYSVHPFLLQGIFLIQGSNLRLLLSREFFITEPSGKGHIAYTYCKYVAH